MALEALVTALACLSTTSPTVTEHHVPVIMRNSIEPFQVDNFLMRSIQYMTDQLKSLKMDLNELEELITEYKNQEPIAPIESRIFQPVDSFAMTSVPEVNQMPRNCLDQKHGELRIKIEDGQPFYVNCDQKVRDGGWTVIAYRYDGSEDFNRDWNAYKSGFGALNAEFFIGLDKLNRLTLSADHELLIIMRSKTGEERFAVYDLFGIGSEAEKYMMNVLGAYRGDAGDSLRYHSGRKFTTFDQDNDDNGQNCARTHAGAWWYGRECFESNLFGTFQFKYGQEIGYFKGILWKTFVPGPTGSLRYVRMLIRPHRQPKMQP
ncbi:hypothetical protein KR044_011940 [Drosophila immigrans]|nr:hypothetical protein KR044_011940 [Drosophila immigrans]